MFAVGNPRVRPRPCPATTTPVNMSRPSVDTLDDVEPALVEHERIDVVERLRGKHFHDHDLVVAAVEDRASLTLEPEGCAGDEHRSAVSCLPLGTLEAIAGARRQPPAQCLLVDGEHAEP